MDRGGPRPPKWRSGLAGRQFLARAPGRAAGNPKPARVAPADRATNLDVGRRPSPTDGSVAERLVRAGRRIAWRNMESDRPRSSQRVARPPRRLQPAAAPGGVPRRAQSSLAAPALCRAGPDVGGRPPRADGPLAVRWLWADRRGALTDLGRDQPEPEERIPRTTPWPHAGDSVGGTTGRTDPVFPATADRRSNLGLGRCALGTDGPVAERGVRVRGGRAVRDLGRHQLRFGAWRPRTSRRRHAGEAAGGASGRAEPSRPAEARRRASSLGPTAITGEWEDGRRPYRGESRVRPARRGAESTGGCERGSAAFPAARRSPGCWPSIGE